MQIKIQALKGRFISSRTNLFLHSPRIFTPIAVFRFKSIRGMRNRIAHDYGAVDFAIVWDVAKQEIPALIKILEAFLKTRSAP